MLKTISFIGTGVGLDLFDFLLGITGIGEIADEAVDSAADILIPGMAFLYGIPLAGKKADQRLFTIITMEVAKVIPLVNLFPEYTYETWKLIQLSRQEDEENARKAANDNKKQTGVRTRRALRAAQVVAIQQTRRLAQQEADLPEVANDRPNERAPEAQAA